MIWGGTSAILGALTYSSRLRRPELGSSTDSEVTGGYLSETCGVRAYFQSKQKAATTSHLVTGSIEYSASTQQFARALFLDIGIFAFPLACQYA